jgi:hypothetical protein
VSGDINNNFADLAAQVNALRADLLSAKQLINGLIFTLVDGGTPLSEQ